MEVWSQVYNPFGNAALSNENSRTIELDDESDVFKSKQEERDEEFRDHWRLVGG